MSSKTTIRLLSQLGDQHNAKVTEWRDLLTNSITTDTASMEFEVNIYKNIDPEGGRRERRREGGRKSMDISF